MATLSGCTLIRNGVTLKYPLEASLKTYLPICDEVVVAYDPTSTDGTEKLVNDLAARYRGIRLPRRADICSTYWRSWRGSARGSLSRSRTAS